MRYISENTEFRLENTVVALGKFDGLHKGHCLLLDKMKEYKKQGYQSAVFTFDISPMKVVYDVYDGALLTREERLYILSGLSIDILVEYPFTREFSQLEPRAFVEDILIKKMDMKALVVGEDFRFGRNKAGDVALLKAFSREFGFVLSVVKKREENGGIVSTTRIKELIKEGRIDEANALMGRPYMISGSVVSGNQIGRTIAYPTANLPVPEDKALPPMGVYAVEILIDHKRYHGIANLGKKPTVQENGQIGLETFLFDFNGDLYGRNIRVFMLHFIRPEQRFEGLDRLTAQIGLDVREARRYFG